VWSNVYNVFQRMSSMWECKMKLKSKHLFKAQWAFPEHVKKWLDKEVEGYSLHVCCGSSDIGDIKLDLMPQNKNVTQADMFNLPFPDNTFDTIICDPPWAIGIDKRWGITYQLRDALKWGGKLLFNGLWIPRIKGLEIKDVFISCGNDCMQNIAIWTKYKKVQSSL